MKIEDKISIVTSVDMLRNILARTAETVSQLNETILGLAESSQELHELVQEVFVKPMMEGKQENE